MSRLFKGRSDRIGLPPGSLVHVGEKRSEAEITVIDYGGAQVQERKLKKAEEVYQYRDRPTVTWINVDGLHQIEVLEEIGKCFGLHRLVLEDILNTDHRPKVEDFGKYIYIVLKMLSYDNANNEVVSEQVSLVLGSNFVLSFQEDITSGDVFNPIRERIRTDGSQIRTMGADYLAYSLMDIVIDNYFVVLETLGERIDDIEEELVTNPASQTLQGIHNLKKEMLYLRKSVWPLREVIYSLERSESQLVTKTTAVYLRDVYDHTIQVIDTIETFRDTVSGMLDIYLSSVSNRLNSVMKVLTVIATIFMPLTFLAGVYGMNFRHMPELEWTWGYPVVLLVMFSVGISMLVYFRKKKWL
jgi:magnesium transporter